MTQETQDQLTNWLNNGAITGTEGYTADSLRSKRFRLVSEQRNTEERDSRFWPREKWNKRHFSRGLWLSFLVLCSLTARKRLLRRLYSRTPLGLPLNTDTSRYYGQFALSLGKGLESPYIFSEFDPLNVNTRTFYMFLWPHQFPC